MIRIVTFALLLVVSVLALAAPGQAQLAGELRVADRSPAVTPVPSAAITTNVLTASSTPRPGWYRSMEDRGVR